MPLYLAEEVCGVGDELVFPNISSCVAVIGIDNVGNLAGAHLTVSTKKTTIEALGRFVRAALGTRPIVDLRVVGLLREWKSNPDTMYPAAMRRSFAGAFDYDGLIRGFDLGPAKKTHTFTGEFGMVVRAYTKAKDEGLRMKVEFGGPPSYTKRAGNVNAPANVFSARTRADIAPADGTTNFDRTRVTAVTRYTEYPVTGALTPIKKKDYKTL